MTVDQEIIRIDTEGTAPAGGAVPAPAAEAPAKTESAPAPAKAAAPPAPAAPAAPKKAEAPKAAAPATPTPVGDRNERRVSL